MHKQESKKRYDPKDLLCDENYSAVSEQSSLDDRTFCEMIKTY